MGEVEAGKSTSAGDWRRDQSGDPQAVIEREGTETTEQRGLS